MKNSSLDIGSFFETPLIVDEPANFAALNRILAESIRGQCRASGFFDSHREAKRWESNGNLAELLRDRIEPLLENVCGLADSYTHDVGIKDGRRHIWVPEISATILRKGGGDQYRSHPGAHWTALYYVDDGYEGSRDHGVGGELLIEDPRMPMILMDGANLRFRASANTPPADTIVKVRPAAGRLLLFPAWLRYGTASFFGAGERVMMVVTLTPVQIDDRIAASLGNSAERA